MPCWIRKSLGGLLVATLFAARLAAAEFSLEKSERGVVIKLDGQLFTEYLTKNGSKPTLWPIIGPTGQPITRAYPMEKIAGEKQDHPHQRSFWFTHGDVNGVDFWAEGAGKGRIEHREFVKIAGGGQGTIVTRNEWIDAKGTVLCRDERKLGFLLLGTTRAIDFDVTVTAVADKVTFGDTKEGSFGVRVPTTMDVDQKGRPGGRIVNSDGLSDAKAWGKPAAWVDYSGPVAGQTVGIAILNHPSSFRFPTTWHVRTYGLFAANPFGLKDFTGKADASGAHSIQAGESFSLRYRVLLHSGDEKAGKVAELHAAYASEKK